MHKTGDNLGKGHTSNFGWAKRLLIAGLSFGALAGLSGAALADPTKMTLTSTGSSLFSLSTFLDNIPNQGPGGVGPVGIGFTSTGQVMVSDYASGVISLFGDTDGQLFSAGTPGPTNFGGNNPAGLVNDGGLMYLATQATGTVLQLNNNASINHVVTTGLPAATGIAVDPLTGDLYVSGIGNGIWKINPTTGAIVTHFTELADGITVSADGSTIYAASGGEIIAINTTTGLVSKVLASIGGADGTAIGTSGALAGQLFVNTNLGTVDDINLTTDAVTVIATGGSRGDFVSVDPITDTLLLTQTDEVLRLTPLSGGFVPPPSVPEPGTLTLLSGGLVGLVGLLRRRKKSIRA